MSATMMVTKKIRVNGIAVPCHPLQRVHGLMCRWMVDDRALFDASTITPTCPVNVDCASTVRFSLSLSF